ncbi:MAG: FkbM family methyltransferase [Lachnospiraceae bacterium]|jgi:FkbM family methyltransferase|nr:FkbM family methyltransferase [Lachnospiraceae bacterium]
MNIDQIKEINEKLMDSESKRVFASRILYSMTGDKTYLRSLGAEFERRIREDDAWIKFLGILKEAEQTTGVVLYGAGAFGEKILRMSPEINWKCVIDKNSTRDSLGDVPVESVTGYLSKNGIEHIVISSKRHFEDMREFLLAQGVSGDRIVDGTILYDLTEGRQYFDLEALPHSDEKEVFLDVGCCDGMSSIQFLKWCQGNGYCYCFEPDRKNISLVKNNMEAKNISNIDYSLIPKGAWKEDGTLSFVATGNGSSHIDGVYGGKAAIETESIDVTKIDNVVGERPITFIKMDIEGAELNALRGAEKVICRWKPKLAICIYHKTEDIWEIPDYILRLRPDYRFYLRHYSFDGSETVLYAV